MVVTLSSFSAQQKLKRTVSRAEVHSDAKILIPRTPGHHDAEILTAAKRGDAGILNARKHGDAEILNAREQEHTDAMILAA